MASLWDSPLVSQVAFHPRPLVRRDGDEADRVIEVAAGVRLGARVFLAAASSSSSPVVLHFHGNAETVADAAGLADVLFSTGRAAALMAIDYRGFGWSSGLPSLANLCADAERVAAGLPQILASFGLGGRPLVVYGRSIGGVCAVHLAARSGRGGGEPVMLIREQTSAPYCCRTACDAPHIFLQKISGLILDSALVELKSLPVVAMLLGSMPPEVIRAASASQPFDSLAAAPSITCPILAYHSILDEIVPSSQAQALQRAAVNSSNVRLELLPDSGHNDVWIKHTPLLTRLLDGFLARVALPCEPALDEAALLRLPVRDLRSRAAAHGLDVSRCIEKSDIVRLLLDAK